MHQEVTLIGRVNRIRNLGGLTFIDLRDRYGITQITIDPKNPLQLENGTLEQIKAEFVIQVKGTVISRPENMINQEMTT
ncbi:hypothetical protein IJM86_01900 [bacterium]|nr:hypothetical protein [bacterium]